MEHTQKRNKFIKTHILIDVHALGVINLNRRRDKCRLHIYLWAEYKKKTDNKIQKSNEINIV